MQKHFLKFGKVFTNVACTPLILISNNSELAAKYLPNDVDQSIKTLEIQNINNVLFQGIDIKQGKNFLLADSSKLFDIKIKGEQATFVKTFPNFKKCFGIILAININKS